MEEMETTPKQTWLFEDGAYSIETATILIIKIQEQKKQKTRTPYYSKCNVEASKNAFKQFCVVTTFTVAIVWGSCFRLFILFHSLKICDTFHMNRMTKLIYDGYFL